MSEVRGRVQPVNATLLVVYRQEFQSPKSFAGVDCRIAKGLFDHLIGGAQQRRRDGQSERLRGIEVDRELEFRR